MAGVVEVNDKSFDATVLKASKVAMVDFAASWCPPCKILEPIVKEVAASVEDKAVVAHLDIDESRDTANRYGVLSVPTMIFFKGGREQARLVGVQQKQTILTKINDLAAK